MDMEHGAPNGTHDMQARRDEWKMKWKETKAIRVLTAVIVLIFVFWCGFQLGEIRGMFGHSMRGGMQEMRGGWSGGNVMYRTGGTPPVMQGTVNVTGSGVKAVPGQ